MPNPIDEYTSKTGLQYFWGRIKNIFATKTELGGKVDKVAGKGLSEEDYTSTEKTKLGGIAAGAEQNIIISVSVNGSDVAPQNRNIALSIPVRVSELTNDSGYQTSAQVASAIAQAIGQITTISFNFDYSRFEDLPATGTEGTIYFIPDSSGTSPNTYTEYVWSSSQNKYEEIGAATIDVSALWAKDELVAITTAEIDTILAG